MQDTEEPRVNEDEKQPGLGEIIYSVDDNEKAVARKRKQEKVAEAERESFPASDPPSYTGASADPDDSGVAGKGSQPER